MYIETVPNRGSRPAVLLRESFRENGRVRKRTLTNLSDWPTDRIEALRAVLRGGASLPGKLEDAFKIVRTRPHGHVAAVLGTLRALGLEKLIDRHRSRERDLTVAMIIARIIDPRSKLATVRGLCEETLSSTLGELLDLATADEDELYGAMDWLLERQASIEDALAARHLTEGTFVLYDVSSTYFEGRTCSLAKLGHSRDGKKDKLQVVFGLLCDAEGRPVAVEVFDGNTGDPKTVAAQVKKLRARFGLKHLVLIGDRGMLTTARIKEDLRSVEDYEWITALRAPAIQRLVKNGNLQLSLFDRKEIAEITDPSFPGERLVVCKNPLLAAERARKRIELLAATERELDKIVVAVGRRKNPLRGKAEIGVRVGRVLGRYKMAKHFRVEIGDASVRYQRKQEKIDAETALDGFYVIRASVPRSVMDSEQLVAAYKGLSVVERAFRSCKTVDLKIRPIHHHLADRVRAHVLLCMLAYYVEWHMRQKLAPILFDDDAKEEAELARTSIVRPAQRSASALDKAHRKRSADGLRVHSFQTLLRDLATLAKNRVQPSINGAPGFDQITTPTAHQQRAFDLLGVNYRM
jgi:transposase